jgi:hypothetical protein
MRPIRGAVQYRKQSSKKVAVGGFWMGGELTILSVLLGLSARETL